MLSKMMRSKNHTDILAEYYKRLRIPGAGKYAREMKKLYKTVFNLISFVIRGVAGECIQEK